MLKSLRRKFVMSIMLLTGIVMLALVGSSAASAQASLDEIVERSLSEALDSGPDASSSSVEMGHLPVLWFDLAEDGVTMATNARTLNVDEQDLGRALSAAVSADSDAGRIADRHLSWRRARTSHGIRVAIADTATIDAVRAGQVRRDMALAAAGLLVLFGVSMLLARWATRPVERAWEQQRRFVADASHELKTPLAVIAANAQILAADKGVGEQARRWVRSTSEEARRMRGLIEDMLELARTEQAETRRTDPVELAEVVRGVALQFDAVAFEHGCEIACAADDLTVSGDASQLERLTKALLDNACKYADAGTTIDVRLVRDSSSAVLSVTNRGSVIPPEDLPHLFERFYRSDKARARKTGGYGLGLAIAKGICEQHGGTIGASSTAGAGTTLTVRLPLAREGSRR